MDLALQAESRKHANFPLCKNYLILCVGVCICPLSAEESHIASKKAAALQEIRHVTLDKHNNLHTSDPGQQVIIEGGWRNRISQPAIEQLGIAVLDVWNVSLPLWDYHHNYQEKQDCTHMCHPSAYQA